MWSFLLAFFISVSQKSSKNNKKSSIVTTNSHLLNYFLTVATSLSAVNVYKTNLEYLSNSECENLER